MPSPLVPQKTSLVRHDLFPGRRDDRAGWIFGYDLESLPDFLSDHTLLEKTESGRIHEHFDRWTQFIGSLWRENVPITYALRASREPDKGRIRFTILGRLGEDNNFSATQDQALMLSRDVGFLLEAFGLDARELSATEVMVLCGEAESITKQGGVAVEVRQEEYVFPVRNLPSSSIPANPLTGAVSTIPVLPAMPAEFIAQRRGDDALLYGVLPWWGAGDPFLLPFQTLAAQTENTLLYILLHPTVLTELEQKLLASATREAASLARLTVRGSTLQGQTIDADQQVSDPVLEQASRIYSANLQRLLHHPFLVGVFCLSADLYAAPQVARAFANTLRTEIPHSPPQGEPHPLPSGARLVPTPPQIAGSICRDLNLYWLSDHQVQQKMPNPALVRLRALVDASGAACAFRLPVSVRGGVPGITVRQRVPDFHPGQLERPIKSVSVTAANSPPIPQANDVLAQAAQRRNLQASIQAGYVPSSANTTLSPNGKTVMLGKLSRGGVFELPVQDFAKHALITGFTGSGKTLTVLTILHQLWIDCGVPFLALESAKEEYRGLLFVDEIVQMGLRGRPLRVYTLGNETGVPFRFNPFELLPGVRVEAHIAKLQTCFEAALPAIGPIGSIISEALIEVYRKCGWLLTDTFPDSSARIAKVKRRFPVLSMFVNVAETVIGRRDYQGDVKSNVIAAIIGRMRGLTYGSKGRMFDTQRMSPDPFLLFESPIILEMNDLNLEDKALVTLFILTALREWRENHKSPGRLSHITVIEEAHNVLENVGSQGNTEGGSADMRYKAVQSFCAMLAEIRALGEGLIIADQSPEKLARDAMRNTNVQIAHQLRDGHDREAVANAMIMDDEQQEYLGKLKPGEAGIFVTGLQKATFLQVEEYGLAGGQRGRGFRQDVSIHDVQRIMETVEPRVAEWRREFPLVGCSQCTVQATCPHRETMFEQIMDSLHLSEQFDTALKTLHDNNRTDPQLQATQWDTFFAIIADLSAQAAEQANLSNDPDAAYCYALQQWYMSPLRIGIKGDPSSEMKPSSYRTRLEIEWRKRRSGSGHRIFG